MHIHARSYMYTDAAEESRITGTRWDIETFATFDYPGSATKRWEATRNAQLCQSKLEIGRTILQTHVEFSGTVPKQRTASHLVFNCTKGACCRQNQ